MNQRIDNLTINITLNAEIIIQTERDSIFGLLLHFYLKPDNYVAFLSVAKYLVTAAFRLAPSARNGQSWQLLIVTDPAAKERIREASPSKHGMITEAPAVLVGVCTAQNVMTNGHRVDSIDVSIAMSFAMLEAHELGLGTCWMANYTEPELRAALGLPENISVVAIMPVGYADEAPAVKPRKPADEIIKYI